MSITRKYRVARLSAISTSDGLGACAVPYSVYRNWEEKKQMLEKEKKMAKKVGRSSWEDKEKVDHLA